MSVQQAFSPMSTSDEDTARTTFRGRGRGSGRIRGRGIRGRGRGAIRGRVGTMVKEAEAEQEPVAHFINKTLHDSDTASLNVSEFKPSREPGSYIASDDEERLTPLNFFKLFFTEDLAQMICDNSNKYAEKHKDRSPFNYSRYPGMIPSLLYHLVGLSIYFGLEKLPTYDDYWITSGDTFTLYGRSFAGKGIIRFYSLWDFLHVSDPDTEDLTDRLCKVCPIIEHLNSVSERYFQPGREISIDKRQYIKNKPVKWGFKLWCLCDCKTGYTYRFAVYRGKQGKIRSDKGLAYDVVTELVQGLENQGYHLYTDNFYSSPTLLKYLKTKGFEACETVDTSQHDFPPITKATESRTG